jgi:predicted nucleic acid-binding protein
VIGWTLDTGALIALERRQQRMWQLFRAAREDRCLITVPANVVAEWWRKRPDLADQILACLVVEGMGARLARQVGETIAAVRGAGVVDASVMASAAQRGDMVLTSDVDDLERIRKRFPNVRLLRV